MHSHGKLMSILDLFDIEKSEWSFDEMSERLGFSQSTLYRYLKVLIDAGFLSSFPGRGYTLGPRIIQMDYQIIASDPLIHAARPIMRDLVARYSCVALLCRRYRQAVMCVHQEISTTQIRSVYERGRSRPLLRGAASLVILAHLSPYQLNRIYQDAPESFAGAGLGGSLEDVRLNMKAIRRNGWYHTRGAVTPGVIGIAAPIFDAQDEIVGSINLTFPEPDMAEDRLVSIGDELLATARMISDTLK